MVEALEEREKRKFGELQFFARPLNGQDSPVDAMSLQVLKRNAQRVELANKSVASDHCRGHQICFDDQLRLEVSVRCPNHGGCHDYCRLSGRTEAVVTMIKVGAVESIMRASPFGKPTLGSGLWMPNVIRDPANSPLRVSIDAEPLLGNVPVMTPAEADERILLSRTTLDGYRKMIDGSHWPVEDLPLFEQEIEVLEAIAEEHPGKINQLISLVAQWAALQNRMQAKLH